MPYPIYLDHAATTPVAPEVLEAMQPYFSAIYGNPSSLYSLGIAARHAVNSARETLAEILNATPEEIVFTSGGTESDNTAVRSVAEFAGVRGERPGSPAAEAGRGDRALPPPGACPGHLLATPIEHHAVLEPLTVLAHAGFAVEYLPVNRDGYVAPEAVAQRLRADTLLVSVMHANNEIGTIQAIGEIGALCRARRVLFHTDAVQTFGSLPIDVRAMKIDLLSLSAHKFYGPKGVGALYVRRGTPIAPLLLGGGQEQGRRGGTLNVPGIVGLGKAAIQVAQGMAGEAQRLTVLRDALTAQVEEALAGVHLSGSRTDRLPNNVHFCVEGVEGEPMLLGLDAAGLCASAGSACTAGSSEPSHVLLAIGVPRELARGALRITLGRSTAAEDLPFIVMTLAEVVSGLRALSGSFRRSGTSEEDV